MGAPHPDFDEADGYGLFHSQAASRLGISPDAVKCTFDPVRREYVFQAADNVGFDILFPVVIKVPGYQSSITIRSTAELVRYKTKGDCACPKNKATKASAFCHACSTAVSARVVDADGTEWTLEQLDLLARGRSVLVEVVYAVLLQHARDTHAAGAGGACLPLWFVPGRVEAEAAPEGAFKSLKVSVSTAAGGFPPGHAAQGCRAVVNFSCDYCGPHPVGGDREPRCLCPLSVLLSDKDPHRLRIVFSDTFEHRHAAALCPDHGAAPCLCAAHGLTPPTRAAGALSGLFGAAQLDRVTSYANAYRMGNTESPTLLHRLAAQTAPPLALLYRNEAFFGSRTEWETELRNERARARLRQGLLPATDADMGGAVTPRWRQLEQLVRCALRTSFMAAAAAHAACAGPPPPPSRCTRATPRLARVRALLACRFRALNTLLCVRVRRSSLRLPRRTRRAWAPSRTSSSSATRSPSPPAS